VGRTFHALKARATGSRTSITNRVEASKNDGHNSLLTPGALHMNLGSSIPHLGVPSVPITASHSRVAVAAFRSSSSQASQSST